MSRFKPKEWLRPRSRRYREAEAEQRHPDIDIFTETLKDIWRESPAWARPAWAKRAWDRGWIASADYFAIEEEPTGLPGHFEFNYEENPFLSLLKVAPWPLLETRDDDSR